jgi:hypothetical protein
MPRVEAETSTSDVAALKANVARLEAEMAAMKALLERIRSQLGIS